KRNPVSVHIQRVQICHQMSVPDISVCHKAAQIREFIAVVFKRQFPGRCKTEEQGKLPDTEEKGFVQAFLRYSVMELITMYIFRVFVGVRDQIPLVREALPAAFLFQRGRAEHQILIPVRNHLVLKLKSLLFAELQGQTQLSIVPECLLKLHAKLVIFGGNGDRKSTRLNSSHVSISYAVF